MRPTPMAPIGCVWRVVYTAPFAWTFVWRTTCTVLSRSTGSPRHGAVSNRVKAGIYRFRIVASGGTLRGVPFTREQLASAAVWAGGDQPYQPPRDDDQSDWCSLLTCLLSEKSLSRESEERLR